MKFNFNQIYLSESRRFNLKSDSSNFATAISAAVGTGAGLDHSDLTSTPTNYHSGDKGRKDKTNKGPKMGPKGTQNETKGRNVKHFGCVLS